MLFRKRAKGPDFMNNHVESVSACQQSCIDFILFTSPVGELESERICENGRAGKWQGRRDLVHLKG